MTNAHRWRTLAGAWLLTALGLGLVHAQVPAVGPLPSGLEQEARELERMLIAPCCWMQPVSDHQSQAAEDVKQQIRTWLAAGKTREQVLDAFVEQYGARILAEPPNKGLGRWLYLGPVTVFGLSAFGLIVWVRRLTAARSKAPVATEPEEDLAQHVRDSTNERHSASTYEERLDDELREMD